MGLVFQAAVIGLIQGLTEFIPVSSSAHLALAPWLFGWEESTLVTSLEFDVFLHLATLIALLAFFWTDWWRLIRAGWASVRERRIGADPDRRLFWLLALATIPAALIGFVGEDVITSAFHGDDSLGRLAIAGFLVVGGALLWIADRMGSQKRDLANVGTGQAIAIGFSQAAALLPGISRSGATIATGLWFGFNREAAARFSFLLATPITLGAGLYGSRHLLTASYGTDEWLAIAVGFVTAAVSGWIAIRFMLNWLRHRSLAVFSIERFILAAVVGVAVLAGR